MTIRVTGREPRWVARLKLLYLTPMVFLLYLPVCLYLGAREYGPPWNGIVEAWKGEP